MENARLTPVTDASQEGGGDGKYTQLYKKARYFSRDSTLRDGGNVFDLYDGLGRKRDVRHLPYLSRNEVYGSFNNEDSYRNVA